jgi:hypothetical protein
MKYISTDINGQTVYFNINEITPAYPIKQEEEEPYYYYENINAFYIDPNSIKQECDDSS